MADTGRRQGLPHRPAGRAGLPSAGLDQELPRQRALGGLDEAITGGVGPLGESIAIGPAELAIPASRFGLASFDKLRMSGRQMSGRQMSGRRWMTLS